VHLSNLTPGKVLAVAVLEGGRVREARVELSFTPTEAQLNEAEQRLYKAAEPIRASTPAMMELFEAIGRAFAQGSQEEYREGMGLLLSEPEAQNPLFLRQAIAVFEAPSDPTFTPPGGMNVRVGEEEGLSLVQAGIKVNDQVGELTLLGPVRMRYERALSVAFTMSQVYMGKWAPGSGHPAH
jgi:heat-inducible transcriptional repressor